MTIIDDITPVCSVCVGKNSKDCICDGIGTIYGENSGLRRILYKLKKENELLRSELIKDLKSILKGE